MPSKFRFDAGTDIAAVAAWDPFAVPDPTAESSHSRSSDILEEAASAGRVFLVHTGADGGGPVEVWVGESLPAEQRASCLPVEDERRLDIPTGGLIVAGAEIYLDHSATPSSRPEVQRIPPGAYTVQAYLPAEDSPGDPEEELLRQVPASDVQYFDRMNQRGCMFGLAMLALVFPLAHFFGWMAAVATVNPLNWVVRAERALFAGDLGSPDVLWGWVAAFALAAVGLWAGVRAIRKSS